MKTQGCKVETHKDHMTQTWTKQRNVRKYF